MFNRVEQLCLQGLTRLKRQALIVCVIKGAIEHTHTRTFYATTKTTKLQFATKKCQVITVKLQFTI